jgi:hypothetical protein
MKRLSLILATLAIAGFVFAQTNEVTSVNVVGYNKITLLPTGKLVICSLQFDPFDPTLNGVLGTNILRPTAKGYNGDQLFIYSTAKAGYDTYQLSPSFWWYNISAPSVPTNPPLVAGQSFWIQSARTSSSNLDIAIMGEVVDVATQQITIVSNLQMIAYPFSCDTLLNQTGLRNSGAAKTGKGSAGDSIYLWDATAQGYNTFQLSTNDVIGWYNISQASVPETNVFSLGQGFWYKSAKGAFSWQETNVYLNNLRN